MRWDRMESLTLPEGHGMRTETTVLNIELTLSQVDDFYQILARKFPDIRLQINSSAREPYTLFLPDGQKISILPDTQRSKACQQIVEKWIQSLRTFTVENFLKRRLKGKKAPEEKVYAVRSEDKQQLIAELYKNQQEALQGIMSQLVIQSDFTRCLLDMNNDAIISCSEDFIIEAVNPAAVEIFGLDANEIIGQDWLGYVVSKEEGARFKRYLRTAALPQRTFDAKNRIFPCKFSSEKILDLEIWFDRFYRYQRPHYVFLLKDRSLVKRMEADLHSYISAKQLAEMANESKSLFLASMSHEIRTPLNSVLGFMELLLENFEDKDLRLSHAKTIRQNARVLLQLVDDILDLSKVDAGKLNFVFEDCSLPKILSDIENLFRIQAAERGLSFQVVTHPDLPEIIVTDEMRLKQILMNLLGNALKFTQEGSVVLSVTSHVSSGKGEAEIQFEVRDTGRGISQESQGTLFQPFAQGDVARSHSFGGAGLGLILSKRLAEGLDGDLELVWSEPDQGSLFRATIRSPQVKGSFREASQRSPIAAESLTQSPSGEELLRGLKFLVVDDSADNRLLLKYLLDFHGGEVTMADNGLAAIETIHSSPDSFDVVFMDLQMPVMDGLSAIKQLREEGYQGIVFALSAGTLQQQREEALSSGFNEHFSKPLNMPTIIEKIQTMLGPRDRSGTACSPTCSGSSSLPT